MYKSSKAGSNVEGNQSVVQSEQIVDPLNT
jgi:hypothetical protein